MSLLTDAITGFNTKLDNTITSINGVNSTINTRAAAVAANTIAAKASEDAAKAFEATALASKNTAVATQTAINHKYRGVLAANPATRTDGTANQAGDYYVSSSSAPSGLTLTFNGSTWQASDISTANLAAPGGAGLVGRVSPFGSPTTVGAELDIIYPASRKSLSDVIAKAHAGNAITIACYGDSLTYGQDTSVNGQATQINSSSTTRSRHPYPESLADALNLNVFTVSPTVYNRGYPGDTAAMGFSRWSAAFATDIAILMFGTNDGKVLGVTIAQFRADMAAWIERELGKGAVVILMTPPLVNEAGTEKNIAAYRLTVKKLAAEYGLLCIDTEEQLSGLSTMWAEPADLVHLSAYAYAELGWQLSALFVNRDLGAHTISADSLYWPADSVGNGGLLLVNASAKSGSFIRLTTNQRYIVCGYFDADVLPIIHSYNAGAGSVNLMVQYGGNGVNRGITATELAHVPSVASRQSVAGPMLRKGFRTFSILNSGVENAFIEGIEFANPSRPVVSKGMLKKSQALSGVFQSARLTEALGTFWTAIDYSNPLTSPYTFTASVNIVDLAGLAVFTHREGPTLLQDFLFVFRIGNDLSVRDFIGVNPTTSTAVGAFTAGAFNGEISIELTGAQVKVYLDGVLKITVATVVNVSGVPALMAYSTATNFKCYGAMVQGNVKTPYAITP